jgi:hypothetical protein
MRVKIDEPSVVAVSGPDETCWGRFQFPALSRLDESRIAVIYSLRADSVMSYGAAKAVRVSADRGRSWNDAAPGDIDMIMTDAIVFPDGEALRFPRETPVGADGLALPEKRMVYTDPYGRRADCYRLCELPDDLRSVRAFRRLPGQSCWREEVVSLDIPDICVRVWRWEWDTGGFRDPNLLVHPHIHTEFGWLLTPDGGLLLFLYETRFVNDNVSHDVLALRSDDRGRNWRLWGAPGHLPAGEAMRAAAVFLNDPNSNYNRLWGDLPGGAPVPDFSGALFEPSVISFSDGRIICVMRSDFGGTHQPVFITRSSDWGKAWSAPEILTPFGVMPRLTLLDNGMIAMVYGRPGVQLLFCGDGKGDRWISPLTLLPEPREKTRVTAGRRGSRTDDRQAGHDDTCGNCAVLKNGPDKFFVAYSDFRHREADGTLRKAIKTQEITVNPQLGDCVI